MTKHTAVYGPPGTGKTTHLVGHIADLLKVYDPKEIVFLSHTKAAAKEAAERLKSGVVACTIHSLAYKMSGMVQQQVVDWKKLQEFAAKMGTPINGGNMDSEEGIAIGDELLGLYNLASSRCESIEAVYHNSHKPADFALFKAFCNAYRSWKEANGYADFGDMLASAMKSEAVLPIKALVVDEAQDLSPAQWGLINKIMVGVEHTTIAGDQDQCQPADTVISTPTGDKLIQDVRDGDLVLSYSQQNSDFGARRVKVSNRHYSGLLFTVDTGANRSSYTANHRCMVKFKADPNIRVLYLMRKGTKFRVGQTKAFKFDKRGGVSLYPVVRARQEKADGFWILDTFENEQDAYVAEQLASVVYGVPQTIFDFSLMGIRGKFTDSVWGALEKSGVDLLERAKNLLAHYGKDLRYPHIRHNGGTKFFQCFAINLDPKLHKVASLGGVGLNWVNFELSRKDFSGLVYSLDVEKTGTYFADQIYTHNSLYVWGGADPDGIRKFEEENGAERVVLDQSWRVPGKVHRLSQTLIRNIKNRVDVKYSPKKEQGSVNLVGDFRFLKFEQGQDTMVLYRNHMIRKEIERELMSQNIPFTADSGAPTIYQNKYAACVRTYLNLSDGLPVSGKEVENMAKCAINQRTKEIIAARNFKLMLTKNWWVLFNIPAFMVEHYRKTDLRKKSLIRISSIHGSKGREADRVIIHTGMTQRTAESMDKDIDQEIRVWYVGATRAKKQLDIVEGDRGFDLCRLGKFRSLG